MADKFYILEEGQCVVTKDAGTEREREVARFKPGDYFGELALLKNAPRAAKRRFISQVGGSCAWFFRMISGDFGLYLTSAMRNAIGICFEVEVSGFRRISSAYRAPAHLFPEALQTWGGSEMIVIL